MNPINILIADDHQLLIDGLAALIGDSSDIHILGTAINGQEAIALVETHPDADLLVIDINMPVMDGLQAIKHLRKVYPKLRMLVLTQNIDNGSITRALKAGVEGYIIKSSRKEDLLQAIRAIAAGETYFSEHMTHSLISSLRGEPSQQTGEPIPLSEREKQILRLIAMEYTTNEIAERLFLSPHTVEAQRKYLIRKLGVKSLAGLVKVAVQRGLVDDE